jgi:hypothetical protein
MAYKVRLNGVEIQCDSFEELKPLITAEKHPAREPPPARNAVPPRAQRQRPVRAAVERRPSAPERVLVEQERRPDVGTEAADKALLRDFVQMRAVPSDRIQQALGDLPPIPFRNAMFAWARRQGIATPETPHDEIFVRVKFQRKRGWKLTDAAKAVARTLHERGGVEQQG